MKITLSKNQWELVGKKAGWIKKEALFGFGKPKPSNPSLLLRQNKWHQ